MIKDYVFQKPADSKENLISFWGLCKLLENDRTAIYQNGEMRLSIDQKVVRVVIFDEENDGLKERLRRYFYGEEYEAI